MKLEQVRRYALALPEVNETPHFKLTSFRVRGKIFATAPPDGDHLHVFVDADERERALAMDPAFLETLPWGAHIVGLRVNLALAMPSVVERLLFQAWTHQAPARRVSGFDVDPR